MLASKDTCMPLVGRFLTFASIIRVNQIEVSRDRHLGLDEHTEHTPEHVAALRAAVGSGWPGGRMTWALSWLALHDETPAYVDIRRLLRRYHEEFGDEVTFIPGAYFANAYNTREQVNRDLHEGLARLASFMGEGYRPKAVIAGFLAAENQRFLAEEEGIHVCQGNIWSQYAIDNQDGDGSICYPYYPSREHFCKPAQSEADRIDCVNLDGWTCDFLCARREGFAGGANFCSRRGVGPIETLGHLGRDAGLEQMLATTAVHFDRGHALNGLGWITNTWEVCLVQQIGHLDALAEFLREIRRRWPDAQMPTHGEFGLAWRTAQGPSTDLNYRFEQTGTGAPGSEPELRIRWFMNRDFRLALLGPATGGPEQVIDCTRYDLPASEPQALVRNWSLLGEINQKQTRPQDRPRPLVELSTETRARIFRRLGSAW